jgi:type II secretory pathway pseudopilin PulG
MIWVLLVVVVIALIGIASAMARGRATSRDADERRERETAEQLEAVKRAADEDVTVFGDDLRQLDVELAGHELDATARQDYQRALDGYEAAKQSVAAVTRPDQVRHVAEILEDGRYSIACVRARVAGEPIPQRRSPCFFNPQHGPSVKDITWSPIGGAPREVPVCAADADRIASGAEPMTRQVMVGPQRMPYWQAGPAFQPWTAGYFGAYLPLELLFVGTMMGGLFDGDGGYDQGYDAGYDAGADQGGNDDGGGGGYDDGGAAADGGGYDNGGGFDGGGFDGGGFDGGGFDGGGDFGGGDFGGGDF